MYVGPEGYINLNGMGGWNRWEQGAGTVTALQALGEGDAGTPPPPPAEKPGLGARITTWWSARPTWQKVAMGLGAAAAVGGGIWAATRE